jgi:hypothetical protein
MHNPGDPEPDCALEQVVTRNPLTTSIYLLRLHRLAQPY